MRAFRLATIAVAVFVCSPVCAQTSEHVSAVRDTQGHAYAISASSNGCPVIGSDMFGWPGSKIRKCVYARGKGPRRLTGLVYLLDVAPEVIARWIETSCANQLAGNSACFAIVLQCSDLNSNMMFVVSGNMLENMKDPKIWKNYFFRNGMTVRFHGQKNGTTDKVSLDRQEAVARMANSGIDSIPSGSTRYWGTLPANFATRYPDVQVPKNLNSPGAPRKWLDIAKAEFLPALDSPTNRLLEAWVAANRATLRGGKCP